MIDTVIGIYISIGMVCAGYCIGYTSQLSYKLIMVTMLWPGYLFSSIFHRWANELS